MRDFNVVKMDSKGRLLIPFHIRNYLGLENGIEMLVLTNGTNEIKAIPLIEGQNATIKAVIRDIPGSLAKTTDALAKYGIDVLMSQSKTLEKGKLAEWSAMVDISQCKDLKKFKDEISKLDVVEEVEVLEK